MHPPRAAANCAYVGADRRRAVQVGPFFYKVSLTPIPSPHGRGGPRDAAFPFETLTLTLALSLKGEGTLHPSARLR